MDKHLQARLPDFVDLLLDAVFLVDAGGRIAYISAASERIFGYRPDEMVGRAMIDFVAPEDRERTLHEAALVMAGEPRIGFENHYVRKDGRNVRIMWSARWSEADELRIGVARDVTAQRHAEERQSATYAVSEAAHDAVDLESLLGEIHRIIAGLVPLAGFAVAICDRRARRLGVVYQQGGDGGLLRLAEHATCRCCSEAVSCDERQAVLDDVHADRSCDTAAGAGGVWLVMPLVAQEGAIGGLLLKRPSGTVYSDDDMDLLNFVSAQVATAIERRRLHAELMHAARYDELTGLPNRRLFDERMKAALALCRRHHSRIALLYIDVDDFKEVNDSFGHAVGDLLLQEIARRLKGCVRETDVAARWGGDEFVVLVEDVRQAEDASTVADKIHAALAHPVDVDDSVLHVRASIGIAVYPLDGEDLDQLLKHADAAMYQEKKTHAGAPG